MRDLNYEIQETRGREADKDLDKLDSLECLDKLGLRLSNSTKLSSLDNPVPLTNERKSGFCAPLHYNLLYEHRSAKRRFSNVGDVVSR